MLSSKVWLDPELEKLVAYMFKFPVIDTFDYINKDTSAIMMPS